MLANELNRKISERRALAMRTYKAILQRADTPLESDAADLAAALSVLGWGPEHVGQDERAIAELRSLQTIRDKVRAEAEQAEADVSAAYEDLRRVRSHSPISGHEQQKHHADVTLAERLMEHAEGTHRAKLAQLDRLDQQAMNLRGENLRVL